MIRHSEIRRSFVSRGSAFVIAVDSRCCLLLGVGVMVVKQTGREIALDVQRLAPRRGDVESAGGPELIDGLRRPPFDPAHHGEARADPAGQSSVARRAKSFWSPGLKSERGRVLD